jgi:O-antigen ligase/tetratricopeptide (TPR) repeat protein
MDRSSHRHHRRTTSESPPQRFAQRADAILLQVVDGGLAGCVFVVPLLMGGRHPFGQLVLVVLAAATALAWAARQCFHLRAAWRPVWPALLLLAGALLLVLQVTPLPAAALERAAPHTAEILPLWTADSDPAAQLGQWQTVSLTPAATRSGLVLLAAYGLLFVVTVQRIGRVGDVERLLRWCALSALCMALFGLLQLATSNGKFFWVYEHPFSRTSERVKGSFTNANHFAHFLALGIGPLIWWLQDASRSVAGTVSRRPREEQSFLRTALVLGLGIVLLAALLSLSRGGAVALLSAAVVCTLVYYRASALGARFALMLGAVAVLLAGGLEFYGYDRVSRRLSDLSSGSLEQLDRAGGRRMIWTAVAAAIPDYRLLGSGAGSHREVYPMYLDEPDAEGHEFTHTENCYLQVALETGAAGLALVLAGIGWCGWWCVAALRRGTDRRVRLCAGAIAASLTAAVVHAAVDFVWYVPALMAVVAILAAAALRLKQIAATSTHRSAAVPAASSGQDVRAPKDVRAPRAFAFGCAAAVLLLGAWMVGVCVGPAMAAPSWDRYIIGKHLAQDEAASAAKREASPRDSVRAIAQERHEALIAALEEVVLWEPDHHRAHLELAECYLRLFDLAQASADNPMTLGNVRDAAIQSQFASREALDAWLSRAVGGQRAYLDSALRHARRSLALCPLQGAGYIYLAELCFLEGNGSDFKTACVAQALRVRPFDGGVLYAAATEALLAGDHDAWLDYLQRSYRTGRGQQQRMIEDLIAHAPEEHIEAMIDFTIRQFDPDLSGLRWLHAAAERRADEDALAALRRYYAQMAEAEARDAEGAAAGSAWLEALRLYRQLYDTPRALACGRAALACEPENYDVRYGLALCLIDEDLYEEAESHLRWCLLRKPQRGGVAEAFKEALRGRLDRGRTAEETGKTMR